MATIRPSGLGTSRLFGLTELQAFLQGWPNLLDQDIMVLPPENAILGRIQQILSAAAASRSLPTWPDLAVLLRHTLMERRLNTTLAQLQVPDGNGWPDYNFWYKYGLEATRLRHGTMLLQGVPWQPEWLPVAEDTGDDVFAATFARVSVRQPAEVPIDPFLQEVTGYQTYMCPGQREAVRSAFFMPAGTTLVVNLPTGSGKTLVGQAPVLVNGLNRGLTLFVVPTKALAIDLGRRMRELLEYQVSVGSIPPLVWHGGIDDDTRVMIKANIRAGRQGILFAMPEAVSGALLPALYDAATANLLRYLVIDEAHMVAQWGDGFRPDFQLLSGVRRGLLRRCPLEPFRTVLMSATLSRPTLETLETLFGPAEQIQMVSAVHLRPEPCYWVYRAGSWLEKHDHVLDLLRHAPRPFILYVTKRDDARRWLEILRRREGYERVACFHGETVDTERESIIDQWAADRLDGLVATSAFGVGMDKADIPTIIHAAVPETLDRYYQEVGRGGRAGYASISVMVYTDRDIGTARSLSRPKILTDDNAFDRWTTMFRTSKAMGNNGLVGVDLTVLPSHLTQQTDYNTAWNVRTLILLARAGLINLDSMPPSIVDRQANETDAAYDERLRVYWEEYTQRLPLRTLDLRHLVPEHFEAAVSFERQRGVQHAESSFADLMAAIKGRKEMSAVLSALYADPGPGRTVLVSRVCRGCPADPPSPRPTELHYQIPAGIGIERVTATDVSYWYAVFPHLPVECSFILYPPTLDHLDGDMEHALVALVARFGIREVAAWPDQWKFNPVLRRLHRAATDRVMVAQSLIDPVINYSLPLCRVSFLWPWSHGNVPHDLFALDRPLHVILAPADIASDHPLRQLVDTASNHTTLDAFLRMSAR